MRKSFAVGLISDPCIDSSLLIVEVHEYLDQFGNEHHWGNCSSLAGCVAGWQEVDVDGRFAARTMAVVFGACAWNRLHGDGDPIVKPKPGCNVEPAAEVRELLLTMIRDGLGHALGKGV